jgi:hypothetical protein
MPRPTAKKFAPLKMMELRTIELGWVRGPDDDPEDQCAHGKMLFSIGTTVFVQPDRVWTVSAAGRPPARSNRQAAANCSAALMIGWRR